MDAAAPVPRVPDKGKRDEWTEDGVMSLLEVYESKWLLRNRAKLKGSDWEDIARQVSVRCLGTKAFKTPIQCKNKVESMKKRYRAESADPGSWSSWQFYSRMDGMLKGAPNCSTRPKLDNNIDLQALPKMEADVEVKAEVNLLDSNHDGGSNTLPIDVNVNVNNDNDDKMEKKESRGTDSNVSAPRSKVANGQDRTGRSDTPSKRRKGLESEMAESIRLLTHSILKIEEERMEMYRDLDKMRVEAEIKRGEMDLKRTEIIAETQMQIAKLYMKRSSGTSNKSRRLSLRDELDILPRREGKGH